MRIAIRFRSTQPLTGFVVDKSYSVFVWIINLKRRWEDTSPPPLPYEILVADAPCAGSTADPIRNQQYKQDKDNQEYDSPAGIPTKGSTIVHLVFLPSLITHACPACAATAAVIPWYEQEEQHEDNQEYNRPTCIPTKGSVHRNPPSEIRPAVQYVLGQVTGQGEWKGWVKHFSCVLTGFEPRVA